MKITGLLLLAGLAVVSASPQGLFGGLRNLFGRGGRNAQGNRGGGNNRGRGGSGCNLNRPNYKGRYLVSWRGGCTSFTQQQGVSFCRSVGMRPISLDTPAKEREFTALVASEGQRYFWTGGSVNHRRQTISWPSGQTTSTNLWSKTGGNNVPQPDNREGNERCVAVLNNFYNDGVKFHDVACSHKKPIICELR